MTGLVEIERKADVVKTSSPRQILVATFPETIE